MNYIKQINAFWDWKLFHRISHGEVELYFGILNCANTSKWQPRITIPNKRLIGMCGFGDDSALSKARNKLIQLGLIEYKKGRIGQAGTYKVIPLYTESDRTFYSADDRTCPNPEKSDRVSDRDTDGIYKQNNTKINTPFKEEAGGETSTPVNEEVRNTPFKEELSSKIDEWLKYKAERKEMYKGVGLKSLYTRLESAVAEFGEAAVISVIDYSISNNYRGLFFDRLKKQEIKADEFSSHGADYMNLEKSMWKSI